MMIFLSKLIKIDLITHSYSLIITNSEWVVPAMELVRDRVTFTKRVQGLLGLYCIFKCV
jgi:hypothetical protein